MVTIACKISLPYAPVATARSIRVHSTAITQKTQRAGSSAPQYSAKKDARTKLCCSPETGPEN